MKKMPKHPKCPKCSKEVVPVKTALSIGYYCDNCETTYSQWVFRD